MYGSFLSRRRVWHREHREALAVGSQVVVQNVTGSANLFVRPETRFAGRWWCYYRLVLDDRPCFRLLYTASTNAFVVQGPEVEP